MLTSKQRSEFRAQANSLETTLIVGKEGVTEAVIAEAERLLTARELVKGKVLETALMSAREVSDAICEATGAEGISCVGYKFVIWRFSEKCQQERNQTGRAKRKETPSPRLTPSVRVPGQDGLLPERFGNSATPISRNWLLRRPLNAAGRSSCGARIEPKKQWKRWMNWFVNWCQS